MSETNPIAFAQDLKSVLARYITTTLPISRRYPKLGMRFKQLVREETLVQGPYVEALPDFEKGLSIEQLLRSNGGFLHEGFRHLPPDLITRRLHRHQEDALRLAIEDRESFLTATGTGSGKTETFLYPIAHELLSDPEPEKPGVRALLIYPMNALANDQLYYRVAPLFARYLKDFGITFGRYTGQVKAGATRPEEEQRLLNNPKLREALGEPTHIPKNWLLTRDEMLARPPKLLITNYAMLEHLLLLPRNAPLFATNALRFIVLDEIHTYYGAQATEVAFLLRKLKTRLGGTPSLQVFGTSASLSSDDGSNAELKKFASDLLGEPVEHVVRGRRLAHGAFNQNAKDFSLPVAAWLRVGAVLQEFLAQPPSLQTASAWNDFLDFADAGLDVLRVSGEGQRAAAHALVDTLAKCSQVRHVAQELDGGKVIDFRLLSRSTFATEEASEEDKGQALSAVIQLGMVARKEGDFPLLPGRYHMAVNSIEGLAVLPGSDDEGWADLRVGRTYEDEDHGHYFALMVCRKCGQPFLEGWADSQHLHTRRPDAGDSEATRAVFWLGKPINGTEDEVDDNEANEQGQAFDETRLLVNPKTGEIGAGDGAIALYRVRTEKDDFENAHYVKKCPACGGRSSNAEAEVITRMHPGNESLGAVVAQRVIEALPPAATDYAHPKPGGGRGLLTFSDNRQDAAFFAPYFERTSENIALRSAVRQVLEESPDFVTIRRLAERVFDYWRQDGGQPLLLDANGEICTDRTEVVQLLKGQLAYEFCTPGGRRNSLESLGIASVSLEEGALQMLQRKVLRFWPASLPQDEASQRALTHILLETIRRERALACLDNVSLDDESVWGRDYNGHRTFDSTSGQADVRYKWLPSSASRHNRRSWYLVKRLGMSHEEASDFLLHFWEAMVRAPGNVLKARMPGFGLDGDLIRIGSGMHSPLYQCPTCGLLQRHVLLSKCTAFGCEGEVVELADAEREALSRENHYLATYAEPTHRTLRAREHTASLSTELREEIEQEFSEKRLNLLSCTTTMEMGVDLGDLEAVVNLNVPPGVANYQQRTGRAGRRAQAAPFCVTVARNMSYDQAVFRDLKRYLDTPPSTPFINLANAELFLRHQTSVVLSYFLRRVITKLDVNALSLKHLFTEDFTQAKKREFFDNLYAWLESEDGRLALSEAEALGAQLPADARPIAVAGSYLVRAVVDRVREFAEDVSERCVNYSERTAAASAAGEHRLAGYWQTQRERYMDQFLVNELSRRGLIPTYSFPVHSLTLEVQTGRTLGRDQPEVAMSRDASFGISEYAPGAEVVANGRIWESAGLARYPKAFMPERYYVACAECFHVDIGDTSEDVPSACSNCGHTGGRRRRRFLEPKGFVTSAENRRGRDPGGSRRRVKPADEARLIAAPRADQFSETELPFLLTSFLSARGSDESPLRGSLFIANRGAYGEGYYRCLTCNFCQPFRHQRAKPGKLGSTTVRTLVHKDPMTGDRCSNDKMSKFGVDFAHTFDTDIRLLRFLAPLPSDDSMPPERLRSHQERIARTIAEAFRLAASDMLHLHPGELRSTYRLYSSAGNTLEVVLYDGVPGGAGYSRRLGEPGFSFEALLTRARKKLDCPAHCESACRACLCDYGNQRYWDSFERTKALVWLNSLTDEAPIDRGLGGYVPWASPSLASLNERFAPYAAISVMATALTSSDVSGDPSANPDLRLVLDWLQQGKQVRLYVANPPAEKPTELDVLMLYRHLYPWVSNSKLSVFQLPEFAGRNAVALPRMFSSLDEGAPLVRQRFPVQPIFKGLVSGPVELGTVDSGIRALLDHIVPKALPISAELFQEGTQMSIWELDVGTRRDFGDIFRAIQGCHVKAMTLKDPYCGSPKHRRRIRELVEIVKGMTTGIDGFEVYCSETHGRDGEAEEFRHDVARAIEKIISSCGIEKNEAYVKELGSNRGSHDRELLFKVADASGSDVTHRYLLTGGLDYLLHERSQTKVIHIQSAA